MQSFRQEMDVIGQEVLTSVTNAVVKRAQLVIGVGGYHLKSVTFHT